MHRSVGIALAVLADELLGDPQRGHPVAVFGSVAAGLERRLYRDRRAPGVLYALLLTAPPTLAAHRLERGIPTRGRLALVAACGWAALGGRSLRRTAARMGELVEDGDLDGARELAPALVGRCPDELDGPELIRAALESLAENTADAVAGPLVWGAAAGAAGIVAHRAVNTLDAMVGYRSERYRRFGWAAARLDDVLGWPVARLTALSTVVAARLRGEDARGALRAWRREGPNHPSPNAGQVEAAFAGALNVTLGGVNHYGGHVEERPLMGSGPRPDVAALERAVALSATSGYLLTAGAMLWAWR